MKSVNKELDTLRKIVGVMDKHSKYFLLKDSENLKLEEKAKLTEIFRKSACLRVAHELKEELREIYETSKSVKSCLTRMRKWLQQAQVFYRNATQTIRNHLEEICNHFIIEQLVELWKELTTESI